MTKIYIVSKKGIRAASLREVGLGVSWSPTLHFARQKRYELLTQAGKKRSHLKKPYRYSWAMGKPLCSMCKNDGGVFYGRAGWEACCK